ncbi:hypothetical protein L1285_08855 [Pseudoalteromonas sp. DL2-H2.2]|uniref:hypothetical protein n=1 Tax=Pseudoalteromonas sp. DL2-H2.2 TaxID=2908889 RepID=UPI001F1F2871|nr:hypothetical protein [Pseudoalteromonas sp. DL2-H2.2]MCF2908431.1 hypothetical protein [Pseudoalteromonas sp. DL2-H2.2]
MGVSEQVANFKTDFAGEYIAEGLLGMGGFLFYYLGCLFFVDDPENPTVRFHADGFGDDFVIDTTELVGAFNKSPQELVKHDSGKCTYTLKDAELEEGVMILSIFQDDIKVGEFKGESEGVGEAFNTQRPGKLTIPKPKEHKNNFYFKGSSGIESINFYYGNVNSVTPGQPWGEITSTQENHNKTVKIVVDSGRKADKANAKWFNETVNSDGNKMFHTRGGDNVPSKLNFAIKGILEINGEQFNVCLGQGTSGTYNNWHLASEDITSPHPHKAGDIGDFHLTQSGSDEFIVRKK